MNPLDWILDKIRSLVYWMGFHPSPNTIFYSPSRGTLDQMQEAPQLHQGYIDRLQEVAERIAIENGLIQAATILDSTDSSSRELREDHE